MNRDDERRQSSSSRANTVTVGLGIFAALATIYASWLTAQLGARSAIHNTETSIRGGSNQARCDALRSQRLTAYRDFYQSISPYLLTYQSILFMILDPDVRHPTQSTIPDPAAFDALYRRLRTQDPGIQTTWLYARLISVPEVQSAGDALLQMYAETDSFFKVNTALHQTKVSQARWNNIVQEFVNDMVQQNTEEAEKAFNDAISKELNAPCS